MLTRKAEVKDRYPHSFQLLCKQQLFLFIAGRDGSPRGCPERQRPNHGDHNEKNDQKPQVSEMHSSGREIRHILRGKEVWNSVIMQQRGWWKCLLSLYSFLRLLVLVENVLRGRNKAEAFPCFQIKKVDSRTVFSDVIFINNN